MISVKVNTLPEGWKVEELEKLIDLIQNGISSKQNDEMIGYPVSRIETIQNSTFDKNRIKYVDADNDAFNKYKYDIGDISFSHINSYEIIGKVAIYRGHIDNLLHGVNLLRLKFNDKIYSEYGYYFFKSSLARKEYEQHIKRAINQASINQKNLKSILVPFPPLEEQKRIVAKIDGLFTKIDKAISLTEESLKQAKNLLPSVLKEVFEKGKADGWEEKKLGEVIEKTQNVNPKTSSFDEFTYIDISAVDKALQEIVFPKTVKSIDAPSRAKKSIELDDILFATTRPNLKNIAIVSVLYEFPIASTGFCVVRSNTETHNRYLFYYLISDLLQEQIEPYIRGAQYPAISDKDLKSVLIPVPNLKEQIQVSALFDKISEESKQTQFKLEEQLGYLKQLKSSILSKAFKGEL